MNYLSYPLEEGYINRFVFFETEKMAKHFTKTTLNGKVNEWLKKGFAIHENPCRKELLAERRQKTPLLPTNLTNQKGQIYFPFGNNGFDKSAFYFTPTYLRTYAYTFLNSEEEGLQAFELTTCGGATLYLNAECVCDFIPFSRNKAQSITLRLSLKKGKNLVVVCLDDLAERDTDYYFKLKYLGQCNPTLKLPVEGVIQDKIDKLEAMLNKAYFTKDCYIGETAELVLENFLDENLTLEVQIENSNSVGKLEKGDIKPLLKGYPLKQGKQMVAFFTVEEIMMGYPLEWGYTYFTLRFSFNGIALERKLGCELVNGNSFDNEPSFEKRKAKLLQLVASDSDNVYKALALLASNKNQLEAEAIICSELKGVQKKKDCSDFHFVIILSIYQQFYTVLSPSLKQEIETTALNYRYWIDEPGDDVMWFFSENHALLFHICQYLAGKALPTHAFASGLSGQQAQIKAENLLEEWFSHFFSEFITEWNSSAYIPVDVLGLATLYHLTEETLVLHQKAKKALDMISYTLAINGHKGAVMTSFGRTYEKELKGNYSAGTSSLLYLLYNQGFINRASMGYIALALSNYQAPPQYLNYLNLQPNEELIFENTQGFELHVNLYLYKNSEVLLSSAINFKPFQQGYQEHIVQATIDPQAHLFINHPGEKQPYGNGRPNFWAGNGSLPKVVQYQNVSLVHYNIAKDCPIDYTHIYCPLFAFDQIEQDNHTLAVQKGEAYIGVKCLNKLELTEDGPLCQREFVSKGRQNFYLICVETTTNYPNLKQFFTAMQQVEFQFEEQIITTTAMGKVYSLTDTLKVNGLAVYSYPLTVEGKITLNNKKKTENSLC